MKPQKIRTKAQGLVEIGGWLDDKKGTYLWLGLGGKCIGTLYGQPLYRLAKAIVKRFEEKK